MNYHLVWNGKGLWYVVDNKTIVKIFLNKEDAVKYIKCIKKNFK